MRSTSKFISLILRHKPEVIGITLDEHGWADVQALIDGVNATGRHHLTLEALEEIVRTDEKQRYAFNEDHTRIRANQGGPIKGIRFRWTWNWSRGRHRQYCSMALVRNM